MKSLVTKMLAVAVLGALVGPTAVAETAAAEKVASQTFDAWYYDGTVFVDAFAMINSTSGLASARWIQVNYATGEGYDCWARSVGTGMPFVGSVTLTRTGSVGMRFTPMGGNCPFTEIVVPCWESEATIFRTGESNWVTRGVPGAQHRIDYEMTNPQCLLQGVGADFLSGAANVYTNWILETRK